MSRSWTSFVCFVLGGALVLAGSTAHAAVGSVELSQGWRLRSATGLADTGAVVSRVGYSASSWYPITVPSTVLAGLEANGVYSNLYFGLNLQTVPDLTTQSWWYRTELTAPPAAAGQQYWLRFKGLSYRAQIWLNGTLLDGNAVGTLVAHEYNVTSLVVAGGVNALAVLVTPPVHGCKDLAICTVDWHPEAPDVNAGIWGKVLLDTTGPVDLRDPYVKTDLPLPATNAADLTVYVDAVNGTGAPVSGTLTATITKAGQTTITVSQNVSLAANESREVSFTPAAFGALHVASPVLWWPYQFGQPEQYQLSVAFTAGAATSDAQTTRFGVREFSDYRTTVNGVSFVGYKVNGQNIFYRGGGYVWDMLMRWDTATNETHMRYVKDMGLNIVRFEGTLGNEELYDIADREGLMVMAGFVCCSVWAEDRNWTAEQTAVANASLLTQMRALRAHPSALVWNYGSDNPPGAAVLAQYKATAAALHWQNPVLDNVATWSNANAGVKMDGPYVWEPPVLFWDPAQAGSAFGTTAEEGMEAPPPLESLQKFIGPADLWPIGPVWSYHAGKRPFDTISFYQTPLDRRYGTATSADDFSRKSELQNYESERAFFEAWSGNQYTKTFGTIFWMQNNAWPSVHWSLYDYYFKPGGGYFGTKKANEPLHVLYDYFTGNVKVVNSTLVPASGMTASVTVYNIPSLAPQYSTQATLNVPANASTPVFTIPALTGLSTTYFIRLQLKSSTGQVVSQNVYWYSTTKDALSNHANWYRTAIKTYANLSGLSSLPANGSVTATASRTLAAGQEAVAITLRNTSTSNVAFFTRAEVTAGAGGQEVLPVTYTDNYVTLWPGESTTLTARYATANLGGLPARVRVRGYNVPAFDIAVP